MIRYRVWTDDENDAAEVGATDPQTAVLRYVELCDSDDYRVASGGRVFTVRVKDPEGRVRIYDVHGYWDPTYIAHERKEESGEPRAV